LEQKTGGKFFHLTGKPPENVIHYEYWQMVLDWLAEEEFRKKAAQLGLTVPPKPKVLHTEPISPQSKTQY
jgi:hypothetical protein